MKILSNHRYALVTGIVLAVILGVAVGGMVFSPDGKTLAALNGSSVLHLYDVATGAVLHRFTPTRAGGWTALAFSPDGKRLASCGVTNRVCLWDVESRRLLRDFAGHTDSVATLAFSPDGKTLATGSRDKTVRLWDVASGKPLHPALAADSLVTGVAFSPKGDRLASVCFDRRVSVWNVATGKLVDQIEGTCLCLRNILFMPDGLVVTSAFDGKVAVWDLAARRQVEVLPAHKGEASGLSLSRDGSVLVTSGQDQCIRIWDWRKRTDLIPPLPRPEWVPYLAVSPDGTTVAAADFHNSRVQVWRLVQVGAAIEARPILPEEGHGGSVNKLRYFPDGKRFLSRGLDYTVRVWDELTRKELYRISHVDVIAISPDSKLLALAERNDGSRMAITIYDAAKGTPIKTWRHSSQVWALAFALIATRTERITLGSAVTVLSSDDPIRVFQRFSTVDALSNGRAEVTLGRGSFIESFPLFGFDLADYEALFAEKQLSEDPASLMFLVKAENFMSSFASQFKNNPKAAQKLEKEKDKLATLTAAVLPIFEEELRNASDRPNLQYLLKTLEKWYYFLSEPAFAEKTIEHQDAALKRSVEFLEKYASEQVKLV